MPGTVAVGACVRLVGMSAAFRKYDGAEGVAIRYARALGRWHVKLWAKRVVSAKGESGRSVVEQGTLVLAVRATNLIVVSPPASVGSRVRLVQLTSPGEREHNFTEGKVSRWDAKRQWPVLILLRGTFFYNATRTVHSH